MSVRIAVAQLPGTGIDEWPAVLGRVDTMLVEARRCAADLLVLPECVWPTYAFGSPAEYRAARDAGLPATDWFIEQVRERARRERIAICAGYVGEEGGELTNAACYIDPGGDVRHVHRKVFLWDCDYTCFAAGGAIEPFDCELGRVGIMICADARLPEIPATLVARGAQLLLQPTAWVNAGTPGSLWNPQPAYFVPTRARELGVPVASADKWGSERGIAFVGESLICDADGTKVASAGQKDTELLIVEVELPPSHRPPIDAECARQLCSTEVPVLPLPNPRPIEIALREGVPVTYAADAGAAQLAIHRGAPPITTTEYIRVGDVSAARVASDALHAFAAVRAAALRGVHLAIAQGSFVTESQLRTRAAENRVFVLAVDAEHVRLVDPRGIVTHRHEWSGGEASWMLDAAPAAQKEVIHKTNIITGRTPTLYAF